MKYRIIIVFLFFLGCDDDDKIKRLEGISKELLMLENVTGFCSNRNKPVNDVVNIGNSLYNVLKSKGIPIDSIKIEIQNGDFIQETNRVSHSIIYTTSNSSLGIRVRYDKDIDKFHIVGYIGKIE